MGQVSTGVNCVDEFDTHFLNLVRKSPANAIVTDGDDGADPLRPFVPRMGTPSIRRPLRAGLESRKPTT